MFIAAHDLAGWLLYSLYTYYPFDLHPLACRCLRMYMDAGLPSLPLLGTASDVSFAWLPMREP